MKNAAFEARSKELFWLKVDQGYESDQCWLWMGQRNKKGYGIVSRRGRRVLAHRLAYALANGPVTNDAVIRHRCDNPPCVNPAHIQSGSQADNMRDMRQRGRDVRGEKHPNAKLTMAQAQMLRGEYACRAGSMKNLATKYGIGIRAVHEIVHGRRYCSVVFRP